MNNMLRGIAVALMMAVTLWSPLLIGDARAQSTEESLVCCSSGEVDLYLVGSDSSASLTPFSAELGDDVQRVVVESSVTGQETLGTWLMPDLWAGEVPGGTWQFAINYEISNAAGVQINATATVDIGSKSFSASTEPAGSFLAQGVGTLTFDIDVEAFTSSGNSNIELTLTAQAIAFQVPGSDASFELLWGTEAEDSALTATIPLLDIWMIEPEVEGDDVYLAVRLDSPWGLSTLSLSDSISLLVNGQEVTGDPIETAADDTVRVTWTWDGAAGGVETINVQVELVFQPGQSALTGSETYEIETFDTGGGTGTYYPPDEPLRTDGSGSRLDVSVRAELESGSNNDLILKTTTSITMSDEVAFWFRWGLDHLGDDVTPLSPTLDAFSAGGVSDDERVSRSLESVEVAEFERQMVNLGQLFLTNGLGLDSDELLGEFRDFDQLQIKLDLMGESNVVNHPVTVVFFTTQSVEDGAKLTVLSNFIVVQPAPLWSSINLEVEYASSMLTGLTLSDVNNDDLALSVARTPWGDVVTVRGEGLSQDDKFTFSTIPTSALTFAPLPLAVLTLLGCAAALLIGMRLSRNRRRTYLYLELVFMPVVGAVFVFGFPPNFIGGAVVAVALVWWITAIGSPRVAAPARVWPTVACPKCSTPNVVDSDERPFRLNCGGCARVIKIEG